MKKSGFRVVLTRQDGGLHMMEGQGNVRWLLRAGWTGASLVLMLALSLAAAASGCREAGEKKGNASFKTEWSKARPADPGEEGAGKGGGGSILGLFGKGGPGLWKEACAHAVDIMSKSTLDKMGEKEREKMKAEFDKMAADVARDCVEQFRKADEDLADEAAGCVLRASTDHEFQACSAILERSEKYKESEKKKERKY